MLHKNSEMLFQTVLNEPYNKDVRRGYVDALIEEGEPRGEILLKELGKSLKVSHAYLTKNIFGAKAVQRRSEPCSLLEFPRWLELREVKMEEGFITSIFLPHNDFFVYAESLFAKYPITTVQFVDRYPAYLRNGSLTLMEFYWYNDFYVGRGVDALSAELFDLLQGNKYSTHEIEWLGFMNDVSALKEASNAAVRFGRKKAGLRELTVQEYLPGEFYLPKDDNLDNFLNGIYSNVELGQDYVV